MYEGFEVPGSFKDKIKRKFSKIKEVFSGIGEGKKFASILIVLIALAGIGSFTGYTVMVLNQKENLIAELTSHVNYLNASLIECTDELTGTKSMLSSCRQEKDTISTQLNSCMSDKSECENSLSECLDEKSELESSLSTTQQEYSQLKEEYDALSQQFNTLSQNFAKLKCCPDYSYYIIKDGNIQCCFKMENKYMCGAGEEAEEVIPLSC